MDPESISASLLEPFDAEVIKTKPGRGNFQYITDDTVRERLITATGNCFDWTIQQVIFRDDKVVRASRKNEATGEMEQSPSPTVMVVIGRLHIPALGSRDGIGAQPLQEGQGEDAAYKGAESDALKRAAMAFGVGLQQLYLSKTSGNASRASQPPRSDTFNVILFKQALAQRDRRAINEGFVELGNHIGNWIKVIKALDKQEHVEFVAAEFAKRGLESDPFFHVVEGRRADFAFSASGAAK